MSTDQKENNSAFCADEVRARHFGQYAATLFAPPEQRRALLALFAFNSEVAGVRDRISQPLPGEIRLQWWNDSLGGTEHGSVQGHPVAAELMQAIATYKLPVDHLVRLIDAHRFDLYDDPMPSIEVLESYLSDTNVTLLSLAARIYGATDLPNDTIRHAGMAQGFVRVITQLPLHAVRRQLFLPTELLELNGVIPEDIFAGKTTPELKVVLKYLAQRARAHLDATLKSLESLPAKQRRAFLPLALVGNALKQIDRTDLDPFRQPQASRLNILWTLWRASHRPPFQA